MIDQFTSTEINVVTLKTKQVPVKSPGDILSLRYKHKGSFFSFSGICLAFRRKSAILPTTSFILRNVFNKVPVEFSFSFFLLSRFKFKTLGFARKRDVYRPSKLYFLRHRLNQESLVK